MECSNCQTVNPPGSKFCLRCGKALGAPGPTIRPGVPAETPRQPVAGPLQQRERERPLPVQPPRQPLAAGIPEKRRRRIPGVVWFVAGVVVLVATGAVLWALDLVQVGPSPEPVVVTQFVEVTPRPTRERRPRAGDTPGPGVIIETVVVTPVPPAATVAVAEAVEPTVAPEEPVVEEVPIEPELPETAYVERADRGEFSGTTVNVMAYLSEEERAGLDASLDDFRSRSGINIQLDARQVDFIEILKVRVAAGDLPDIAILSSGSMGDLRDLADWGAVVDLGSFLDWGQLLEAYWPTWLDVVTLESPQGPILAGLWSRVQPRSLVYYALDDFEAAGYGIPETWGDLLALSDQMVADGRTPWCIGVESASATGWMAHQWLEEMMLRTATTVEYDAWSAGDLPFDSPQVRGAAEAMARIWFSEGYVYGGRESIATTPWMEAAWPMFDEPAGCMMTYMGPWISSLFPDGAQFGETYGVFPLPPLDLAEGKPLIVFGDVWVMFNDREEVRAVMTYVARGEHMKGWIELDDFVVAPHLDANLDWYRDAEQRRKAEILRWASVVRVPAIDMMLGKSLDSGTLWAQLTAWVAGDRDLDAALAEIEASRQ